MPDDRPDDIENERRYTLSISEDARQHSFEMEDEEWSRENQIKDWLKLLLLIVISLTYHLLIFLLEPGLRGLGTWAR